MNFGDAIKEVRLSRNLSQKELADLAGLAQNVISRIERNVNMPNEKTIVLIADALKIDKEALHYLTFLNSISQNDKVKETEAEKLATLLTSEIRELYKLQ